MGGRSVSTPVLANVRVSAIGNGADGMLAATGSDGDIAVMAHTSQVEVVESGIILIPT